MKKRILESEEKLLVDDDGINGKSDPLDNLEKDDLYSHYSDLYKEKHNIRPRWVHPSDVSVEELRRMIDDLYQDPGYSDDEDDYSDREDNKEYFDDLDAKSSEDSEIEDLAGLGPEDGEELHMFAGMGKGRHGRNRIHEEKPADDYEECDVCGYDHEYDFPHLSDEKMKKIKKLHNKTDEVAPPGGEKLVKALKKQKGIKNPWAIAWSKYNKGELKENTMSNKITIGQLRQIIKEELEKVYFNDDSLDEGWKQTLAAGALGAATLFGAGNASAASHDHAKPEQHQVQKQQKDQKQLVKQVKNVINNANLKQLKDIAQFCSRIKGTNIEIMNLSSMNEDELRDLINKVPDGTEKIKAVEMATGFMKNPNAFWANTIW